MHLISICCCLESRLKCIVKLFISLWWIKLFHFVCSQILFYFRKYNLSALAFMSLCTVVSHITTLNQKDWIFIKRFITKYGLKLSIKYANCLFILFVLLSLNDLILKPPFTIVVSLVCIDGRYIQPLTIRSNTNTKKFRLTEV